MRRKKIILPIILSVFVLSLVFPLRAENGDKSFSGTFLFGYRYVSTTGANTKYMEDINLDDGPRIFNFNMHFTPGEQLKKIFDRIDLNMNNLGGDPYETIGLSIQKFGAYKFNYTRKKAVYFYDDQIVASGALYDHHTFNFTRTSDSGSLKVFLGKAADLFVSFDRYTKEGDSKITFDISRVEFEMDKPIKEDSKVYTLGLNLHIKRLSLTLEERIQNYENTNSLFLPGMVDADPNESYPTALFLMDSNQPYDLKSNTHSIKFNATPFNSLLLAGSAQFSTQKMDLSYSETALGINYLGNPFDYSLSGSGSFNRNINLYNLDATYLLFNRFALFGAFRYSEFNQTGSMTVGSVKESSAIKFDTMTWEGGIQFQISSQCALSLGYRNETRDLNDIETATYEFETKRTGFFGNLKGSLFQKLTLTLDYQRGDYTDPFTLISPTDFDRFRATVKLAIKDFSVSSSYVSNKSRSKIFSDLFESKDSRINVRGGFNSEKIKFFAGYTYIFVEHKGDRTITYPPGWSGASGTFLWSILYEGKSTLIDGSISFSLNDQLSLDGYGQFYTNSGFWSISRNTVKVYLQYVLKNGIVGQLGYRSVSFKEALSGLNDYTANIIEISFGYRWK